MISNIDGERIRREFSHNESVAQLGLADCKRRSSSPDLEDLVDLMGSPERLTDDAVDGEKPKCIVSEFVANCQHEVGYHKQWI